VFGVGFVVVVVVGLVLVPFSVEAAGLADTDAAFVA
jgi:hypothetical protein